MLRANWPGWTLSQRCSTIFPIDSTAWILFHPTHLSRFTRKGSVLLQERVTVC